MYLDGNTLMVCGWLSSANSDTQTESRVDGAPTLVFKKDVWIHCFPWNLLQGKNGVVCSMQILLNYIADSCVLSFK
jgi:hypothetical protein